MPRRDARNARNIDLHHQSYFRVWRFPRIGMDVMAKFSLAEVKLYRSVPNCLSLRHIKMALCLTPCVAWGSTAKPEDILDSSDVIAGDVD